MTCITHAAKVPLLLSMLLVFSAGPLAADQGTPRAAATQQAPAAPAPKPSPLYRPVAPETPTIAEARAADAAAKSSGATVTMSTTALLLVLVILIILVAG